MSLLVVGSVAYDSVRTPVGARENSLGGSATYFSVSGSYFTDVSLVAVVGDDFSQENEKLLDLHGVDVAGLERKIGSTFRWSGVYGTEEVKTRQTLETHLNVFADFVPELKEEHRNIPFLFLANIDPQLQLSVLDQMEGRPRLVALDTMDFWIDGSGDSLQDVVKRVDVLVMDEGEVRSFTEEPNVCTAVDEVMSMGPSVVVVKRGEHGVLLFYKDTVFSAPALPLRRVVDPTGAGDSFAGGFMGYLAASGDLSLAGFRRAAVVGSVMGSFAVESFGLDGISSLTHDDIDDRFRMMTDLVQFDPLSEQNPLL